ncbi:MAG: hypothetical protein R3C10_15405 [Pirellulales bacterium]|nr:hypothetical protein [Planctomycetales bacterium]
MVDETRRRIVSAQREVEMVILQARQQHNPSEEKVELTTDSGRVIVYGPNAQQVLDEATAQLEGRRAA